jgi:hypothetical protein
MDCDNIAKAYGKMLAGEPLTEVEWTEARDALRRLAYISVKKCAAKFKIPDSTQPELIDEVEGALTIKLAQKRLPDPATVTSFEAMMRTVGWRETLSVLRKIKSPLAGRLESDPGLTVRHESVVDEDDDVFLRIRSGMEPFRFGEYKLARDVLLAVRLATDGFPGPAYLRAMVPKSKQGCVYNAAVFDINTAILGIADVGAA